MTINPPAGQFGSGGVSGAFGANGRGPVPTPIYGVDGIINAATFGVIPDTGADQSANLQAFFNAVTTKGGTGYIPPGDYVCASEVVMNITTDTLDVCILAAGANLKPSNANNLGLFRIQGSNPFYTQVINGLSADCTNNSTLVRGFAQNQTASVTWNQCFVLADKNVNAGFAAWRGFQTDPNDGNTGCFWTVWNGGGVRVPSGADVPIPVGVHLDGAINSTWFTGQFAITGCTKGIKISFPTGTTLPVNQQPTANSVSVAVAFEGNDTCVYYVNNAGGSGPYGLNVDGSRFEANVTAVNLDCAAGTVPRQQTPFIGPNNIYVPDGMVLLVNPQNIPVSILNPQLGTIANADWNIYSNKKFTFRNYNPAVGDPVLDLIQINSGFAALQAHFGALKVLDIGYKSSGKTIVTGDYAALVQLYLTGLGSISKNATLRENLAGYIVLNGAGIGTVTFLVTEPNTAYAPLITASDIAVAAPAVITARRTNGFDVAGPANAVIFWFIVGV